MKLHVLGDAEGRLETSLRRWIMAEVTPGLPGGAEAFACAVVGDALPDSLLAEQSLSVLVLVEPGLPLKDAVVRSLAARTFPVLEVVEHVGEDMQADRTWAIALASVMRLNDMEQGLRAEPVERSHLVEGGPVGGSWTGVEPTGVAGLTIGFLGFGPMAEGVAARATVSGMQALYWPQLSDREHREECEARALRTGAKLAGFADVLAESNVVVLDLSYTEETVRIIDAPELALMRRGVFLVNTSHGRAIDEGALLQAVRSGHLGGVGLDRFNYEPLPGDSPLRALERVTLTPGIAVPGTEALAEETARRVALAVSRHAPGIEVRSVRRQVRRQQRR